VHRTHIRFAVAVVALAVHAAACGDDEGSPFGSSTSSAGESTTTAGGEQTTTTATSGEETTTSSASSGQSGDIEDLLARFREMPLRTTYLVGEDRQQMTFSQDPMQDPPVSAVLYEGGKIITVGDSYIVCSGDGENSQCFEMAGTEGFDMAAAMLGPFASLALSLQGMTDVPGVEVATEQVTIAGRSGVCFNYTPDATLGAGYEYARSCIDEELGFTLLVEIRESGASAAQTVMELVSFGDPDPGDFEPTGPVIQMPEG
jgi:hypothetical protein